MGWTHRDDALLVTAVLMLSLVLLFRKEEGASSTQVKKAIVDDAAQATSLRQPASDLKINEKKIEIISVEKSNSKLKTQEFDVSAELSRLKIEWELKYPDAFHQDLIRLESDADSQKQNWKKLSDMDSFQSTWDESLKKLQASLLLKAEKIDRELRAEFRQAKVTRKLSSIIHPEPIKAESVERSRSGLERNLASRGLIGKKLSDLESEKLFTRLESYLNSSDCSSARELIEATSRSYRGGIELSSWVDKSEVRFSELCGQ